MKESKIKEEIDLDMEIIGLLQELTDLCKVLTANQTKLIQLQVLMISQLSTFTLNEFPTEYGGNC